MSQAQSVVAPAVRPGAIERLLAKAWPSYTLAALLQVKVLWGIFEFRDMPSGDTASYFLGAYGWATELTINILWSPLYTVFFGTVFAISGDASTAATLHRVIIAMGATMGVLAVMRALLPPAIALAIAVWWATLPYAFNVVAEVHLFALLPVLAAWLIAARATTPGTRGVVLALFVLATVLVRNELVIAAVLFAAACAAWEWRGGKDWPDRPHKPWTAALRPYALPMFVVLTLCGLFYVRSTTQFGSGFGERARAKHTVNMCQVYAFGYSQRNPGWTANPFTQCDGLVESTFGSRGPSFREMVSANPSAVLDHVLWNASLIPAGLQLSLFNRMTGRVLPDYLPVEHTNSRAATALSAAALLLLAGGLWVASGSWADWREWFGERRVPWTAMAAVAAVAVPVMLTQRPRPSYLFALTVFLMAVLGWSLHVLTHRWPDARDRAGVAVCLLALLFVPPFFKPPAARPLHSGYRALQPLGSTLARTDGWVVLGRHANVLDRYTRPWNSLRGALDYGVLARRARAQTMAEFLATENISVFLVEPSFWLEFRGLPGGAALLDHPESFGWRRLSSRDGTHTWFVLYRDA